MGKRIVLLEMETEDAEEFVRKVAEFGAIPSLDSDNPETVAFTDATVEAVVARPTKWCTCDIVPESKYQRRKRQARRESGWMRGRTFGWWLCSNCKKPSKPAVCHWVTSMLVGANDLLPKILGIGEPINPNDRWREYGGVDGIGMQGSPVPVIHQQMANVTATGKPRTVRTKARRSEADRIEALRRRSNRP